MNEEQRDRGEFEEKMNQWISKQGILFQLKHGATGSGIIASLITLLIRLVSVALVVAVVLWIIALRKGGGEEFMAQSFEKTLGSYFHASEVEVKGVRRRDGKLSVDTVDLIGGPDAFFEKMSIRGISCERSRLGDLKNIWNAGQVNVAAIDVLVRSGSETDAEAQRRMDSLFGEVSGINFDGISVKQCNVVWGYGQYTRGSIVDSSLKITHEEAGKILLEFETGFFSQNWIERAKLEKVTVICTSNGLAFSEGEVLLSPGELTFSGNISVAAIPKLNGSFAFQGLPLQQFIPVNMKLRKDFQGTLSGEGKFSGSPNSSSGIKSEADVQVTNEFPLIIRSSFPLIQALRAIDTQNTYYKLSFTEGGFNFAYEEGNVMVKNLNLKSDELMDLKGEFFIRRPSDEEIADNVGVDIDVVSAQMISTKSEDTNKFSLKSAGKAAFKDMFDDLKTPEKSNNDDEGTVENPLLSTEIAKIQNLQKQYLAIGDLRVGLNKDIFSDIPLLSKRFPMNLTTGRVEVHVKMNEPLESVTRDFSRTLIQDARLRLNR